MRESGLPLRISDAPQPATPLPWTVRVSTKTKIAALAGLTVLIATGASLGYYFAVSVPRAREIERQRVAAIEAVRQEAAEKERVEEELRQRAAAEALAREKAGREAEARRITEEKAAEERRLAEAELAAQAERDALASRAEPPVAIDTDDEALTEDAPAKASPKRTKPRTSATRSKASDFGKKVKHFFGF